MSSLTALLTPSVSSGKPTSSSTTLTAADNSTPSARDAFLAFMHQTTAEKLEDLWLKQNGITREQLDKMSVEDRQKILDKMEAELKEKIKATVDAKAAKPLVAPAAVIAAQAAIDQSSSSDAAARVATDKQDTSTKDDEA